MAEAAAAARDRARPSLSRGPRVDKASITTLVAATVFVRCPLRWVVRVSVRKYRPAPSLSVASASIDTCRPARIRSANTPALSAPVSASSWASSAEWSWVIAWLLSVSHFGR